MTAPPCPICHASLCPTERHDCLAKAEQRKDIYTGATTCIWPDPPPPPPPRKRKRRPRRAKVMP